MATIVTRSGKGSPLTNTEVDANFTNLNTDKAELSGAVFTGAITTNSTIDGRDVATDGTKLDGIEASADVTDTTNVVAALSAGTGIGLSAGGAISNTAPDQTVALTGAGTTSVSGTYPNFTITGAGTTYTAGSGLSLAGTEFANTAPDQTVALTGAGATSISGTYPNFTISSVNTTYSVGDGGLSEINFTSADHTKLNGIATGATNVTNNNQLTNGAGYVTTDTNTTYTAGSGLSLTGTVFANTAPDQTVALTGSGATSISGTYPNFTISSTNTTYSVGDGGLTQINFTSADNTKLDGIATNANNYTLPFTNNSSNWNTAYGWGNHANAGYYSASNPNGYTNDQTAAEIQSLGMARFYNNAVLNTSTTTANLISELTTDYGCFSNNQVTLKVQWSYAGSSDLVTGDATIGTIELAGCLVEAWGGTYKHIRITRPTSGTGGQKICVYNDQGSGYGPAWREIWTSKSDGGGSGLDADLLDGQQGSYYAPKTGAGASGTWPISINGNAATSTTSTTSTMSAGRTDGTAYPILWGTTGSTSQLYSATAVKIQSSTGTIFSTNLSTTSSITTPVLTMTGAQNRTKLRVWDGSTYGMGMHNAHSFGGLNDYAMTFQMNNDSDRGFWWGDDAHTNAQGAMSLTTNGKLAVASGIRVGYGESDTTTPTASALEVLGEVAVKHAYGSLVLTPSVYGNSATITGGAGLLLKTTGGSGSAIECISSSTTGPIKMNAGYGSLQYVYMCRAWGRFEMVGTHSWRDDEGFSSISDIATGRSRLYFTNTMPNAFYSAQVTVGSNAYTGSVCAANVYTLSTSSFYVTVEDVDAGFTDRDQMNVMVVR